VQRIVYGQRDVVFAASETGNCVMTKDPKYHGRVSQLVSRFETSERILIREEGDNQRGAGLLSSQDGALKRNKRPEEQTHEEWLHDLDAASGDSDVPGRAPAPDLDSRQTESRKPADRRRSQGIPADIPPGDAAIQEFRYRGHRTTCKARLVLEFEHVETGIVAVMFFNVLIENPKTGKKYPTGGGGQFTYSEGHKIHRFLKEVFGAPPARPSRAHHQLQRLKHVKFVGEATFKKTKDSSYWELTNLQRGTQGSAH
jgi:hypothetical protein